MKTLQELIAASTPGPLHTTPIGSNLYIGAVSANDFIADMRRDCCDDEAQTHLCECNAKRLAHSYNALPEVVAALEKLRPAINVLSHPGELMILEQALIKANTITP